ncbi:procathepsin L-like [Seriola aureovittata]|uniref:procathepsin L-like n=1 Tax=Seriola aureovittata TaxID=2871759 RepID=UPI0024BE6402|nr:procathepsin L-like [Seriola aureovittata]
MVQLKYLIWQRPVSLFIVYEWDLCCCCFRMLLCACVILLVASDLGFCLDEADLDAQFEQWKNIYEYEYDDDDDDDDEEHLKEILKEIMHTIEVHNREAEQGKHSYKLGMNHLVDTLCLTCLCNVKVYNNNCSLAALPRSIDYREKSMVTPVKDQGSCSSCWAFSAVGALEGQLAKTTGQLLSLSPQNLLDCDRQSDGCEGGQMTEAFEYVEENGGINSEEDYPYMGETQHCRNKPSAFAAQVKGFEEIPEGDECALAQALYHVGPLSVAIDTNHIKFQLYKSGVYYNPENKKDLLDHAMLLVGYGETAEGVKYWIVKNSYGTDWGEEGYIRIARDHGNHCGIASEASYPVL